MTDRIPTPAQAAPVAWCAWHTDRGYNFGTMAETSQGAMSRLMMTGLTAGNARWEIKPLYAAQPPAAPVESSVEAMKAAVELEIHAALGRSMSIKYWWSDDLQWFCILTDDGVNKTTVSLSREQAKELSEEADPAFADLLGKGREHALRLLEEARSTSQVTSKEP